MFSTIARAHAANPPSAFAPPRLDDEPSLGAEAFVAEADWRPAAWATALWVEEQEAKATEAARRIEAARLARGALDVAAASSRRLARRGWLTRLEDTLDRLLPGNLGTLLQLFVCVSLSMALISALLPLVDRI